MEGMLPGGGGAETDRLRSIVDESVSWGHGGRGGTYTLLSVLGGYTKAWIADSVCCLVRGLEGLLRAR